MTLRDQLAEAEAFVAHLRERINAAGCAEAGHDWRHIGGRNACCDEGANWCHCSIPVYECSRCGDCDYGDNDEARQRMAACRKEREDAR